MANAETGDYAEVQRAGTPSAVLFTCEHASPRLPDPWTWPEEDRWIATTHWAYDLGAAELARELAVELRTVAVLARFSRLLADPNRPEDAPELFRARADGQPVRLNAALSERERERRLVLWRGYHDAVEGEVARSTAPLLLAVHTFTPIYEGAPRAMELGVLYDPEEALAKRLRVAFDDAGFSVALNEPYSGKLGLMYSVDRHARKHGRHALEIELRQDLAVDPGARRRVVAAVSQFLDAL